MSEAIIHDTLIFERRYAASAARVFEAYVDVGLRTRWSAPTPTSAIVYSETDFRVGGRDVYRCGAKDDLRYLANTHYCDIQANRRIVYSESVSAEGEMLSVSLNTWSLTPEGVKTHLVVTVQLVAFGGKDMIQGTRFGTNAALDHLGELITVSA